MLRPRPKVQSVSAQISGKGAVSMASKTEQVMQILGEAKVLAQRYRTFTGKPLGITGEVAEFEAARLLRLKLVEARQAGYDAARIENGVLHRLQIKGRCVLSGSTKVSASEAST